MRVPAGAPGRSRPLADPKVSVVIPVFDGAAHLGDAIRSVLGQGYSPLEIIVVDDGSTDDSARIATGFPEVVCLRQENAGPATARNRGIAAATGSLLAFIDCDDIWAPEKLALQVGHLRDHPEDLLTIALFRYFLEPGREIPSTFNRDLLGRDLVGRLLSALVARRGAFETVGEFDPALRTGEDVDWFARAKDLDVPTAVIPHVLLQKRVHDRNTSADAANTARLFDVLRRSIRRKQEKSGKEGSDR